MNEQIIWNDKIDVNYYISTYDGMVRWDGKMWDYRGIRYRSLRELKSTRSYKLLNLFANKLADEIRREIDEDIISKIISLQ